ncbi:protein-tyrosine phosphatase [Mycobacterium sp. OAE908]
MLRLDGKSREPERPDALGPGLDPKFARQLSARFHGSPRNTPILVAVHGSSDTRLKPECGLRVLFVCTGNICRSPTAERLATAYGARLQIPDFIAASAGTRALIGHPVHPDAALVLERLGGEVSNFAARQLTSRIASGADLVLTMTRAHRDAVLELAPRQLHRTFTLSEASRLASECNARNVTDLAALRPQLAVQDAPDVLDPIGQNSEFFSMVGHQIADFLPPILELCRRRSSSIGSE